MPPSWAAAAMNETGPTLQRKLAASSHQQALCALHFFYARFPKVDPPWVQSMARPVQRQRLPLVLSRDEVRAVLTRMSGVPALMAGLLYGSGLRLLECARLRVKDEDFGAGPLAIRNGKGDRTIQELLGHRDVATTMIYTHVLNRGPFAVRSPLD